MMFTKEIHYNINIEAAILGACLLERDAFGKIYHYLDPDNFYHEGNKIVFMSIQDMHTNGIPIDIYTVSDQIRRANNIESIAGIPVITFIIKLTNYVVSSVHIEYHSFLVKTMWIEREIILLTHGKTKLDGDSRNKITILQERLQSLQQKATTHDWADMTELIVGLYVHQEEIKKTGGIGIPCGIKELDRANGGFQPGQMITIGARPSVGKSALAGCMAISMASQGKSVGIVSLEMSNNEIAARITALHTDTDFRILYRGLYKDQREAEDLYRKIGSETSKLPIYVTDKTSVDIIEIKSKAQKLKSLHGLDCLFIDYLQLIDSPETNNRTRENEIAKISRHCKIMAKDLNIPVILLCQLNREVTKRHGASRYPQLSDIRESGSIEQDSDVVIFLHRDWMNGLTEDENGVSTEFFADLVIRKWRNGKSNFTIPMEFHPGQMKFTEKGNFRPVNVDYQQDNPL